MNVILILNVPLNVLKYIVNMNFVRGCSESKFYVEIAEKVMLIAN